MRLGTKKNASKQVAEEVKEAKEAKKEEKTKQFQKLYDVIMKNSDTKHDDAKDDRLDVKFLQKLKLEVNTDIIFILQLIEKYTKEKLTDEEFNEYYKKLDRHDRKMAIAVKYNDSQKAFVIKNHAKTSFGEIVFERNQTLYEIFNILYEAREEKKQKNDKKFKLFKGSEKKEQKQTKPDDKGANKNVNVADKNTVQEKQTRAQYAKLLIRDRERN